ncbi:MAG: response regulator transcription factor [Ignavibacteria bacterium]|nr:response regulator transcription factor [Ignavibacteria bacterium]
MKILLVEDEKDLAKSIVQYIAKENYKIDVAFDYSEAEDMILTRSYECALIDLMLPDGSGFELLKILKKVQPECGIIIITAKNTLDDKILGFDIGADDYLTKPFHLAELNARLKSLIRRKNFKGTNEIIINEITIDPNKREVKINDKIIDLTKREYDILLFLVTNKERVLTKETIVEHVWGEDSNIFNNFDFVYTHIKNLRKKLIENGCSDYIHSVYGIGYKFSLNIKNESFK